MAHDFPLVQIPLEAVPVVGKPDGNTRIYRAYGTENGTGEWFDAVHSLIGPSVSPGGVSMYAPVSRAAVHKRLKEGRLSAFCYHVEKTRRGLFGKKKTIRTTPYVYIPVSECKAWRAELEEKMVRLGHVTQEELEGEAPDWTGDFWEWESNWRKEHRSEQ